MKLALICPANTLFMPYFDTYKCFLNKKGINFAVITWDRFNIEENSLYTYKDTKIGHRRNFWEYYKFSCYVKKILTSYSFKKIVVFGLPLAFFLKKILLNDYKNNYIIDIRDHHKILNLFNPSRIIKNSCFTVVSSPEFKRWLPSFGNYMVNHNTRLDDIRTIKPPTEIASECITISNIGSIKHLKENISLIHALKNNSCFQIVFHGDGVINDPIKSYIIEHKITNATVKGRYLRENESVLYAATDYVNMLYSSRSLNDRTLLSNRLYNAAIYGKPIISLSGTYSSDIVKKYHLGLVLDSFDNVDEKILKYNKERNLERYHEGRLAFLEEVIKDNDAFFKKLEIIIAS